MSDIITMGVRKEEMEKDLKRGLELTEENKKQNQIKKINRYSFYTLSCIMLYSIANVRYNPFNTPEMTESAKLEASNKAKIVFDTPEYSPIEKQKFWTEIDEFWGQKLWKYTTKDGREVELNAIEFDEALGKDFPEYNFLKDKMKESLNIFNIGVEEIYRPVKELIESSKGLLGNVGEILAKTGIFIIAIVSCIATFKLSNLIPNTSSDISDKKMNERIDTLITRVENQEGVKYLSFGEVKEIIETKPIEKSFFDSFYASIFNNPEFNDIFELFEMPQDVSSSSSSSSVSSSNQTAQNSISSVESEGFYGMGELEGIHEMFHSVFHSEISNYISNRLISLGAATYAGIIQMSPGLYRCPVDENVTSSITCEQKLVINASNASSKITKGEALEALEGYGSDRSEISDLSQEYGGKKTRKNKRTKVSKKTKKMKRVKKTKNARKNKKSKKSKKSKK